MNNATAAVVGTCGSEAVVAGLAEALASKQAAVRGLKAQVEREEWETKTKARNSQYVVGSVRKATDADKALLGAHCHGEVCEIVCLECSQIRVINKQDAFQSRYCKEHLREAKKAASAGRRASKVQDPRKIDAQLAKLEARMAELRARQASAIGDLEVEVTDEQLAALKAAIAG